jgi:phage terminase large subunit-like protein
MNDWDTSCLDWENRIVAGRSLIPFAPMFRAEAEAALAIFMGLKIVDAPGSPLMGQSCRPWVFDFVSAVFGSYNHEIGRRLIREFFLLVSKKNSKSTKAAGIMLTALIRNWRHSAEFLILAPTIEVAQNSFKPAADMVREDEKLSKLLHVQNHLRTITHRLTGATLRVVAADSDTVSGKKATGVLVEELWLFGKRNNAENILREATGGLVSRPEGFVIYLSTQSDEPPAGVFRQKLEYFRDVRDGKIVDKRCLGVLYEFPDAMIKSRAYLDPQNFYVTNPNLDISVDREWLEDMLSQAQHEGESSLRGFVAKHLNVQIGMTMRHNRWAGCDFWEATSEADLTVGSLIERCELICVGIDGGGLDDLLGLALLGREKDTGLWLSLCFAWAHRIVLERRKSVASELQRFADCGELIFVDNLREEAFVQLVDIVEEIDDAGKLATIGLDPFGVADIVTELGHRGIEGDERVKAVSQGWKLSGTIKTTEGRLSDSKLRHGDQSLMAWCVSNAATELRGNALVVTKAASGTAKIDPLMALFNAVVMMNEHPEVAGAYAYDDGRELMVV